MMDLKQYGYIEIEPLDKYLNQGLIPGRIIELRRGLYTVITERGEAVAAPSGSFYHNAQIKEDLPCVGDFVLLKYNESGKSLIMNLLPRRSIFSRADFLGHKVGYVKTIHQQVVAVNFDYVFILTSLNRDFRVNRIMRYLTQTLGSGGQPVVILTKADLVDDFNQQISEVREAAPGVPVHAVSSHTGFGFDALSQYLQPGKTVVFLGMSGVGKSSLLNTLATEDLMAVRATRKEDTSKGSHTTTHRQLFMLPSGAMVIDTPGMRELGLYDAEEGISAGFADVEELFESCRFSDCRHKTEPDCAVLNALADGSLTQKRWESYIAQKRENKFVDDKIGYIRESRAKGKSLSAWSKDMKKRGVFRR